MIRYIKKFRNDVNDISSEELKNIKSRKLLFEEYQHINIQLKEANAFRYKFIILFVSAIFIFVGSIMSNIINWSNQSKEGLVQNINIIWVIIFVVVVLLFAIIISYFLNRTQLINRKSEILKLIDSKKKRNK